MACVNIALRRDPTRDPVTVGLELAFTRFGIAGAVHWVQPISLTFVGILVFTSVRGFLVSFANVFIAWSSAVTSNSVVILLAQVSFVLSYVYDSATRIAEPAAGRTVVQNLGTPVRIPNLLFVQVMGMYFISSVLLMRMAMPEQYRSARRPKSPVDVDIVAYPSASVLIYDSDSI